MNLSKVQICIDKVAKNNYVTAISDGLISTLPITMIGSIASLLSNLPIEAYQNFLINTGLKKLLTIPAQLTVNILSLYAVFFMIQMGYWQVF